MLKNYLTIALRAFGRQRAHAIINIIGLSVGLASAIFIFLYINKNTFYQAPYSHHKHFPY